MVAIETKVGGNIGMQNDNTTPLSAKEYDEKISNTIPYYVDFHTQTLSVVRNMGFEKINWLDLGCGTGTLENKAFQMFKDVQFTMVDPSDKMLEKAQENNSHLQATYLCTSSDAIEFDNEFDVVTAIQSHHYMREEARRKAAENVYRALRDRGVYIMFENVIPESEETKKFELQRWGIYQKDHGKSDDEVKNHIARCGVNYFPLTINQHIELLKEAGFRIIHVFWYSYMQVGMYAMK